MNKSIDAVVTWVDGNDPIHKKKRMTLLQKNSGIETSTILAGIDKTRFEDNNEIEYCLRSIRKFAPWIKNIFLVTDNQRPAFLTQEVQAQLSITIVDHKEVFHDFEGALPTFNSLSIETALHRIPELNEKFVYFNDDVILLSETKEDDFFKENRVVIRGQWKRLRNYGRMRLLLSKILNKLAKEILGINRAMSILQQMKAAKLAGFSDKFYKVDHTPHPMRKSALESFFQHNPECFKKNISYPFRSLEQYATTSLANHIEILKNGAKLIPPQQTVMICFNREKESKIENKIKQVEENPKIKFLCIQSFEEAKEAHRDKIIKILNHRLHKKASTT